MASPENAPGTNFFPGERFNTYHANSMQAGPNTAREVPAAPAGKSLHYELGQIITAAQGALIQSSEIMAFHCIGDTGNDSNHNGGPDKRLDVAEMMEAQCAAGLGQAETPCFCYHVGDVIYPGSANALYEQEFYQPYRGYGNAIVAVPGNHDSFSPDGLPAFANNFMQPKLVITQGQRPAMNLPWYYWVLDTPVATIIGLADIDNFIAQTQQNWYNEEVKNADPNKALIVVVHYPPYCFDGSNNRSIRTCIQNGFSTAGRMPDLLISGHSHNFQHILAPKVGNIPGYNMVVNGAGGVGVGGIRPGSGGNGGSLVYGNDTEYGALNVIVDSNKRTIVANYFCAVSESGNVGTHLRHTFTLNY
jgi:predicted phosphodiesterase